MAPMFSSNTLITGGTLIHVENRGQISEAFKLLHRNIASGAFHNSDERFDPPKCHPGTRVAVIKTIMDWVESLEISCPMLWLHGPAGAGKSAIAQMIAELCFERHNLFASFFFSRSASDRNNERKLILTIAYQMALSIPSTRPHIEEAIEQDLAIFTRSLEAQAQRLIIYPLQQAKALNPDVFASDTLPHLILIDGLDECADDVVQFRILDLFCGIIGQQDAIPFIVFIASRPERHIRSMFDCGDLNHLTTRIGLDSSFQPDADIRLFLTEKFDEIKSTHPFKRLIPNPDLWPSKEVIDMLIEKSSGQFILPSTVSKYLQSRRHRPDERLKIICGISRSANEAPYAALDALYIHIFSSAMDIASALRIIALKLTGDGIVLHYPYKANPYSDNYLSVYSERVERFLSFEPGTMEYCMADLESIIAVGAPYNPVGFFHASLSDFLLDRSRSGDYHIDIAAAHAEFAICHLRHLEPEQPRFGSQMFINSWEGLLHHLPPAEPTPELRQEIEGLKHSMAVLDRYVHAGKYDHISAQSFDKLLTAICSSKFPDARELSEEIRVAFDEYQKSKPSSAES